MDQEDRKKSYLGFSSEKSAILVCTDVAARGLDIPKVKCIIQYDSPGEASEYVHRYNKYLMSFAFLLGDCSSITIPVIVARFVAHIGNELVSIVPSLVNGNLVHRLAFLVNAIMFCSFLLRFSTIYANKDKCTLVLCLP
jgi:hypothetical protein